MRSVKHIPRRWFVSSAPISCGKGSSHRLSLTVLWEASLWGLWQLGPSLPHSESMQQADAEPQVPLHGSGQPHLWQGQQAQGLLGHQSLKEQSLICQGLQMSVLRWQSCFCLLAAATSANCGSSRACGLTLVKNTP